MPEKTPILPSSMLKVCIYIFKYAQINVENFSINGKCSLSKNYFSLFKQYVHLISALSTGIRNAVPDSENNLFQTPSELGTHTSSLCAVSLSYRRATQCFVSSFCEAQIKAGVLLFKIQISSAQSKQCRKLSTIQLIFQ